MVIKPAIFYTLPAFILVLLLPFAALQAQSDSLEIEAEEVEKIPDSLQTHSVAKATWLSTAFPGAGQVYNGKYWKLPILYGGLGTCIYLAYDNHQQYRTYLNAFYNSIDSTKTQEFEGLYDSGQLIQLQNIYRKWRDLAIIIGAVVYALNIIDAHVDAHLYYYNVNDDLTMRLEPALIPNGALPAVGFRFSIDLK